MRNISSYFILALSTLLIITSLFMSALVISESKKYQEYRFDEAEINNLRYGLLDANEWKESLSNIISKKIQEFDLTEENEEQLKEQVENLLYRLLDEVNVVLQKDMGKIKRLLVNSFVDLDELRKNVPELAETLLEELSKPENKKQLQEYIYLKIDAFSKETYNNDVQISRIKLQEKYNSTTKEMAAAKLKELVNKSHQNLAVNVSILIFLLLFVFIINTLQIKKRGKPGLLILLAVSIIFLVNGVSIPMINIEAKISRLTFHLLGENIIFENQVLFFQSKSILDVVWLLISTLKIDMIFVGVLIFTFSVLFPFTKLTCSYLLVQFPKRFETNKLIYFFTFKSGKWSMADVFVIALFMAFIGFNGIIKEQLAHLSDAYDTVEIFTTNGTSLQVGFYFFLMFCIVALLLSEFIQNAISE